MGRPQRSEQQRGRQAVAEGQDERDSERERQRERECAERERRTSIGGELVEVELEAGQEHEEEDPELAEVLDDALALHPAEHEGPHEQASQDHADDPGQADPLDEERPHEDHDRGDEERPLRGRRGELDAEEHARSVQLAPDREPSRAGLRGSEISEFARRR